MISASATAQPADVLLSKGKPVATSTVEGSGFAGGLAVDGDPRSRWASAVSADPQWIRIDLGGPSTVHRVKLSWEAAYAAKYRLEVSDDGTHWSTAREVTGGDGGTDELTGLGAHGRFARLVGTERATEYGYSLWEVEVFGTSDASGDTVAPSTPAGLKAGAVTATSAALGWSAATDNVGVTGYDVLRDGAVVATAASTAFTDSGLSPDTAYRYAVRARDAAGNVSAPGDEVTLKTTAGSGNAFVVAAAGDIADRCLASSSSCVHPKTAKLVEGMNPAAVLTMGDNQYDDAHLSDFEKYYDSTWGRFKDITHPVPGNHETYDDPPLGGYKDYFGPIATPAGKTYYSWEKGNWHFIALDSNDFAPGAMEPEQLTWLKEDLAKNTKGCVAAYYHHPRYSSGDHGDNPTVDELWQTLVDNKVDLVLNGHDHHYERFLPQNAEGQPDPAGPTQIIGGTGGMTLYDVHAAHPATAKLLSEFGVLKLNLSDTTFATQLLGLDGKTLDSSPTYSCH
ncbi:discoidin domain-containing protein [Amycolatopsis nigrescens]|uniref:discoidin domain-containing protein n=1 Tax=Amycolatopsis nigrescens TaxID=381445 RepID=UPI0003703F70|nr:discoidin domain-containing protein [Amycolatopsis nigrescens]